MAVKTIMTIGFALEVASLVKSLRKMDGTKRANKENKSISKACNDTREFWHTTDAEGNEIKGYSESFGALGYEMDWITPKVLHGLHTECFIMEDGKPVVVLATPVPVWEKNADGTIKRELVDGKEKQVQAKNADGTPKYELVNRKIVGWNPMVLLALLAQEYKLRVCQYEDVLRAKNAKLPNTKRLSDKQIIDAAIKQYFDYIRDKFTPKAEPAVEPEQNARKPRQRKPRNSK